MPIFKSKDKSGNRSVNFMMYDGISSIKKGTAINVTLHKQERILEIKQRIGKAESAILSIDKITNAEYLSEQEIIEHGKSVAGRAIVGGVLLGPLGAIVGGMSGIGNKTKKENHHFFIINYTSNEEEKVLIFEIVGASIGYDNLMKEIKELANIQSNKSKTTIEL